MRNVLVNTWANRSKVKNLIRMIELMVARNRGEYFTLKVFSVSGDSLSDNTSVDGADHL